MNPEDYMARTGASYQDLAELCCRHYSEVCRWFSQGKTRRNPTERDRRILLLAYELRNAVR